MIVWLWLAFAFVVGTLIVIDLGLVTRRPRVVTTAEALASFFLWVAAAVVFSVLVWYVYQSNWLNIEAALNEALPTVVHRPLDLDGNTAWAQWATAYVLELALSLDNIAIAALLLTHFKIPRSLAGRTLFWTILVSLVARLLLIMGGAWLLRSVEWAKWAFCGLLVLAMLRTLIAPDEHTDFSRKWPVRTIRRLIPVTRKMHGQRLFAREHGALAITPLMLVVLVSCAADLTFAVDSVPAMFSVTRDPLLAFSASAFAILGLRSLYFALRGVLGRFRYLRVSLVFVLLATAGKMFLVSSDPTNYERNPTLFTMAVVASIMGVAVGVSAIRRPTMTTGARLDEPPRPSPLEDLTEAVETTRRNFRKVVILIVGSTIALIGVIIVGPLPGPGGIPVILLGLTILATEFIWARRLLHRMKEQSRAVAEKADRVAARSSPWLVPPVIAAIASAIGAVAWLGPFNPAIVIAIGLGPMLVAGYWGWRTITARRRRLGPEVGEPHRPFGDPQGRPEQDSAGASRAVKQPPAA